jgi:cellulose synthase/poly-beta-1,6-N-acetylglucosamine synthase-like glycosyltransferase
VRNEQDNIPGLLASLSAQDYPAEYLEIIIVNDHSVDETAGLLRDLAQGNISVVDLTDGAGKKAALAAGISRAKNQHIVITDADCRFGREWLSAMAAYFSGHKAKILIGPVICEHGKGLWHKMQSLEFLSLVGVTAGAAGLGSPIMANGANMMFARDLYLSFKDEETTATASGDDVFFILWAKKKYPGKIHFLLSQQAVAVTTPQEGLRGFIHQRLRWASKSRYYRDVSLVSAALTVYTFCTLMLFLLLGSFMIRLFLYAALIMFLSKCLTDLIFLTDVTSKFRRRSLLKVFIPVQVVYPFYIFIIGTLGQLIQIRWKGRKLILPAGDHEEKSTS